jgi:uncharacterized delta-60 repeat protein
MKRRRLGSALALAAMVIAASAAVAPGAPGDLDPHFGADGRILTPIPGGNASIRAIAVQEDGKIVAGGRAGVAAKSNLALTRYHPNGSLDTASDSDPGVAFGGDGIVVSGISAGADVIHAIAVQPNGKIVVAGNTGPYGTTCNFLVARYSSSGVLDTDADSDPGVSFGGDKGFVTTNMSPGCDGAQGVVVQPDGKILVSGYAEPADDEGVVALARYNSDGTLDTEADATPSSHFDEDGKVTTDFGDGYHFGWGMVRQGSKVVVAGGKEVGGDYFPLLIRYNADGSLDTDSDSDPSSEFGENGVATSANEGYFEDVHVAPDGKLVAAGGAHDPAPVYNDFFVARFSNDGNADTKTDSDPTRHFGDDGFTRVHLGDEYFQDVTVQPNGKVITAGYASDGGSQHVLLVRLKKNGARDSSFGNDGVVRRSLGPRHDLAYAIEIPSAKKLLVGGSSESSEANPRFALSRFVLVMAEATITLTPDKNPSAIVATGKVDPSHAGEKLNVTLAKRKQGKFEVLATHHPNLTDKSRYSTQFNRPDNGRCRLKARFRGDGDHKPAVVSTTFDC